MSDLTTLIPTLLPLRALQITLRFRRDARLKPTHQPALTGFLRNLLGSPDHYDLLLTLDAPENGRTSYRCGDHYCFTLFALAGGESLLAEAYRRLAQLPQSSLALGPTFGDNVVLAAGRDHFGDSLLTSHGALTDYGPSDLAAEIAFWQRAERIRLRWLAPARLLREKSVIQEQSLKGERRFCASNGELSFPLLAARLHDSFADLLRRRGLQPSPRQWRNSALAFQACDLFWVDADYTDHEGREQPMGGLMGVVELPPITALTPEELALLVAGQYIGIGQRRAFGYGRYRLETADGAATARRQAPARSLLWHAMEPENLLQALGFITAGSSSRNGVTRDVRTDETLEDAEWGGWTEETHQEPQTSLTPERLETLARQLEQGQYEPPRLQGVIRRKDNGGLRPLAVPPLPDRVLQRAVAQVLTPALEPLFSDASYGYRPRRSRLSVRQFIQQAYRDGYRWVYESDIANFFDTVDWTQLRNRLQALFGDDPLIAPILAWISAPVQYQNHLIHRRRGLPQGSPLSPILANLLLDAFDHELEAAGFKLARFADDFVILCKDRDQAERAAAAAECALAAVGLRLNPSKTHIRTFAQGFHYLGYLFVEGLVLDVGRNNETPAAPAMPPPYSWLADLVEQRPAALQEGFPLPPKAPPPTPSPPAPILNVGDADLAQGAMLCITGPVARLSSRDNQLLVLREDKLVQAVPWRALRGIILLGPHHITTPALRVAMREGVAVHFANSAGHYQGSAWPAEPTNQGWQLWLEQKALAVNPPQRLAFARVLVEARLRHQREVLRQRGLTSDGPVEQIEQALQHVGTARALEDLRGLEGIATRHYFAALRPLLPEGWGFTERNRYPARDPFNALLSLGYSTLYAVVDTVLRADGLMPWIGIYHSAGGKHSALASDMMEPFRHLVERTAFTAVTRQRIKRDEFTVDSQARCLLMTEARNRYLGLLMERFETPITALGDDKPGSVYDHLHAQNLSLIDWLRGHTNAFVCFRMR